MSHLGVFDPTLGKANKFLISLLIFLAASIVETSLYLVYGAFYINNPLYIRQALWLLPGMVRMFLMIIIVFTLVLFAILTNVWGVNKAVVLLFEIISTVVEAFSTLNLNQRGIILGLLKFSS